MVDFNRLEDVDVGGKTVLVRVDFNVPCDENGQITDDTRMRAALPTIHYLQDRGAKTILMSHFGRPGGERVASLSLEKLVAPLGRLMGSPVNFAPDCVGPEAQSMAKSLYKGDVLLLENTRFHPGETHNADGEKGYDPAFAQQLAALGEIFVMDAFSVAHRAQASTVGVAQSLPAYAGLAMERELDHLSQALETPKRPVIGIVGGAKVSTKISVLNNLVGKLDYLVIGGGMANTFLYAQGFAVGKSLCEPDFAETARSILKQAEQCGCKILLPIDVVCAKEFKAGAARRVCSARDIGADEMVLDVGPESVNIIAAAIDNSKTLIWNGPLGAFELPPFDTGTLEVARFTAKRVKQAGLIAVAGGGDTVAALNQAGVTEDFTFVSTAGGAFLEWMEGKPIPGIEILKKQ